MIRPEIVSVVLACLVGSCFGYIVKDGNCSLVASSIPVVTDFNLEQYLGKWYEIERYEQDYQRNLECVTAEYTRNVQDGTVAVKNKGFLAKKDAYASFSAVAVISDPFEDPVVGKLNVTYGIKESDVSNYWVVDTDYRRFAVVYSCTPITDTEASVIEGYWLLSRTPKLTDELQITEKIKYLQATYFVPSHVRATNQSEVLCRKEPEAPVTPASLVLPPLP